MSFELQLAAEAKAIAERVKEEVALIKQHLGQDFQEFLDEVEQKKVAAAEAAKPLELTDEEKQAIISARQKILAAELNK